MAAHNRNNNCFNCHDEQNLELFQTRDGRELSFGDSTPLCGSCHGPTYRDWEAGAHGRTSGLWNRDPAGFKRQNCVSCHNPHSPKVPGTRTGARAAPVAARRQTGRRSQTRSLICPITLQPDGLSGAKHGDEPARLSCAVRPLAASGLAALAASLAPLRHLDDFPSMEQFLQKYYKEMTPEEMAKVLAAHRGRSRAAVRSPAQVRDLKPMDGVEFVYCLNLTRCIGCRKCVHACVAENNQSRTPGDPIHPRAAPAARLAGPGKGGAQLRRRRPCRKRVSSTCRCSASNARTRPA